MTKKKLAGRPRIYDRDELAAKLMEYVDNTDIPIVAEYCYTNNIQRAYLYQMAEGNVRLSNAIRRCIDKKEAQLERKSLAGEVNHTQAIFSLKQLGWTDRQEMEHSGKMALDVDVERMSDDEIIAGIATTIQAINDLQARIGSSDNG